MVAFPKRDLCPARRRGRVVGPWVKGALRMGPNGWEGALITTERSLFIPKIPPVCCIRTPISTKNGPVGYFCPKPGAA
jgi:hypothetical protein